MFAIHCRDKASAAPLRVEHRPAHLDYVKGSGASILAAGPLIGPEGHAVGGLFLIDAADAAAAKEWASKDPFQTLGVYERVEIHDWKYVFGTGLEAKP
ncbi:YciI family protein [Mesorhizobium sp. DCY119]|uniref:YciI family protein n=1 Tax=Mesorhizobium sp. DCY119 TaxID=2108445 RepID=UPI000E6D56EB|nr:YciI family protein [Mesorhizobium sp. DCY119]RJG46260.1 hypothetical protein D3Y55_19740 [Mesorhizobium sp. DCY119]